MRIRRPLFFVIIVTVCMILSSCSASHQGAPSSDGAGENAQSSPETQGDEEAAPEASDDTEPAEAASEQAIAQANHPIVGVWRLSYYVYREEVDGTTYESVDEPHQDVYFYFDPRGLWTMSFDEILDFGSLEEDDFDEYSDWRVTGPSTGELGYGDEITTLTLSDDGMLTLHAEFGEDDGRVIPDRVLERYS